MKPSEARDLVAWIMELFPNVNTSQANEMREEIEKYECELVVKAVKRFNLTHSFMSLAELSETIGAEQRRTNASAVDFAKKRADEKKLDAEVDRRIAAMDDSDIRELRDSLLAEYPDWARLAAAKKDPRASGVVRAYVKDQIVKGAPSNGSNDQVSLDAARAEANPGAGGETASSA